MTPAQEILRLIETVDPADTAKMDEIDARVRCFIENWRFISMIAPEIDILGTHIQFSYGSLLPEYPNFKHSQRTIKYTRSRDALKAVRPEGWVFEIKQYPKDCRCSLSMGEYMKRVCSSAQTEELAEIHAIIQAIEYERTNE